MWPLALVLSAGCLSKRVPVSAEGLSVAAGAVVMAHGEGAEVDLPSAVPLALGDVLTGRSFSVSWVEDENLAPLGGDARLRRLAEEGEEVLLLVELEPRYYGLLSGRYRWTVEVTTRVGRKDEVAPRVSETEIPVFLLYTQQGEEDAVEAAVPLLERHVAESVDAWLRER